MDSELDLDKDTATYVTSSGAELDVTYEKGEIQLPYITNEVRYRMKNIPFFCIPPCESKAYDPARVKAKVDTRNTSYVPKRPWTSESKRTSPQKPRWDSSPLSKSFSKSSNNDGFSPLHPKTAPIKAHGSPARKDARQNGGVGKTGDIITFSSPRRDSGGSDEGIVIKFSPKTRRDPALADYSHVKSKIRTCWEPSSKSSKEVGVTSEKSSNSSAGSSPSTPRRTREGAETKVKRKTSIGFKVTDYSYVTAKVDSNRKMAAGSSEDAKMNKDKRDQVDGKPATPKSIGKLNLDGLGKHNGTVNLRSPHRRNIGSGVRGTSTPVKQGGRSKHIPPAEAQRSPAQKMPSTYSVKSPRNRYANVKAKVDTSDPNPAHQLKRTISDLTIEEGRQINPRFANIRPEKTGARIDLSQSFPKEKRSFSRIKGERASGIRSPFMRERATSELVSKEKMPSMRRGMGNQNSALKRREIPMSTVSSQTADILREVETGDLEEVVDKEVQKKALNSEAFSEEPNISMAEEQEEEASAGIGICGVEVSNNEVETTVVLKHILALSGQNNNSDKSETSSPISNDLAIVEEDELEEEYYESKDNVKPPSEIPSSYNLPHLIPRLIVTDEDKELVETVVSEPRKLEATGAVLASETVGQKYTIAPSRLQIFEEEEEEEDPSTHL